MGVLWIKLLVCAIIMVKGCEALQRVNFTSLDAAAREGVVCLDGGPAGYYFAEGSGDGSENWLVYLEGGGWCGDVSFCKSKANDTKVNRQKQQSAYFIDLFNDNQTLNPDFYNWNRVWVRYCDFGVFLGDVEDPSYPLPVRGSRIFSAVMDDLKTKGLNSAKNVMLSGGSAGALATMLHCDGFRSTFPSTTRFKCLLDGGFFQHAINIPGADARQNMYANVIDFHNLTSRLPTSCTSKMNKTLCLFPENFAADIKTPIFFLESAFDQFQVSRLIKPNLAQDKATWDNCTKNFDLCSTSQLEIIKEFGSTVKATVQAVAGKSQGNGVFIHSCYRHGHFGTGVKGAWNPSPIAVGNITIPQAVGDWFFDRGFVKAVDVLNLLPLNCTKGFA